MSFCSVELVVNIRSSLEWSLGGKGGGRERSVGVGKCKERTFLDFLKGV